MILSPDYLKVLINPRREKQQYDVFPLTSSQISDSVYLTKDVNKNNPNALLQVALKDKSKNNIHSIKPPGSNKSEERPDLILQKADMRLQTVINNEKYFRFFLLYCAERKVTENVLFFREVIKYKNEQEEELRRALASNILDLYFAPESMLQIRVTELERGSLLNALVTQGPTFELFDDYAEAILNSLLIYLFMGFKESNIFVEMLDNNLGVF
ncbi:sorting nexin [Acrasis kona]|uniref:Sorting nexin n=1 Tax=Acrasis kona TaxID=1008807 RepID=A0AAW2ZKH2_9EUKA